MSEKCLFCRKFADVPVCEGCRPLWYMLGGSVGDARHNVALCQDEDTLAKAWECESSKPRPRVTVLHIIRSRQRKLCMPVIRALGHMVERIKDGDRELFYRRPVAPRGDGVVGMLVGYRRAGVLHLY